MTGKDSNKYYKMVLPYMDDHLIIYHEADTALGEIGKYFNLKPNSIRPPKLYLGGKIAPLYCQIAFKPGRPVLRNLYAKQWKMWRSS